MYFSEDEKVHNVNSSTFLFSRISPQSTILYSFVEFSIMSKVSEKVTMGGVETIPTALSESDVTALRPPYIPSKADQEAVPNPGIIFLPSPCLRTTIYGQHKR